MGSKCRQNEKMLTFKVYSHAGATLNSLSRLSCMATWPYGGIWACRGSVYDHDQASQLDFNLSSKVYVSQGFPHEIAADVPTSPLLAEGLVIT